MNVKKWILENTSSLSGKTVALTGSTGGIGRELSIALASLGASLILLDRNKERSEKNKNPVHIVHFGKIGTNALLLPFVQRLNASAAFYRPP